MGSQIINAAGVRLSSSPLAATAKLPSANETEGADDHISNLGSGRESQTIDTLLDRVEGQLRTLALDHKLTTESGLDLDFGENAGYVGQGSEPDAATDSTTNEDLGLGSNPDPDLDLDSTDTAEDSSPATPSASTAQSLITAAKNNRPPKEPPLTKEDLGILWVETVRVLNGRYIDVPITTGRNGKPRPLYAWLDLPMESYWDKETGEVVETLARTDLQGNRAPNRTAYIPELNKLGFHADVWLQDWATRAWQGEIKGVDSVEDKLAEMSMCAGMIRKRAEANDMMKSTAKVIGVGEDGKEVFGPRRTEQLVGRDTRTFVQETTWDYMLEEAKARRKDMKNNREYRMVQAKLLAGWVRYWRAELVAEKGLFVADEMAMLGYRRETDQEYEARRGRPKLKESDEQFARRTPLRKLRLKKPAAAEAAVRHGEDAAESDNGDFA